MVCIVNISLSIYQNDRSLQGWDILATTFLGKFAYIYIYIYMYREREREIEREERDRQIDNRITDR